jgi:signal peptide peptidase SppA
MDHLPHLAGRVFNTPLLIARAKMESILAVMTPKFMGQSMPTLAMATPTRDRQQNAANIAIIPVMGTLVRRGSYLNAASGLTSYAEIEAMFDAAVADSTVKGIILEIDSPGGEAGGVFDLADKIFNARAQKPIWAVANEEAYSAAYAIAAACEKIYLPRTAGVGSVGVIAVHVDQSAFDAAEGIKYTPIFAGDCKNDLSPHQPLTDPARLAVQAEVDRLYGIFATGVARGRKISVDAVKATEAALYFGESAVSAGLADQLGTLNDALIDLSQQIVQPTRALPPIAKEMSMTQASPRISDDSKEADEATGETSPAPTVTPTEKPAEQELETANAIAAEKSRCLAIMQAGQKLRAPQELVSKLIDSKLSLADATASLIDWKSDQDGKLEIRSSIDSANVAPSTNANLSIEQVAAADYQKSAALQAEFKSEKSYVAYRKAEAKGQIRAYKRTA